MNKNKEMLEMLENLLKLEEVGTSARDMEEYLVNKTKKLLMEQLEQARTAFDFRKFTIICAKALLEDYEVLSVWAQEERNKKNEN